MSQDAVLRFRYELTGDGVRAVNALTGEVLKLAAAEETALGRAKALDRAAAPRTGVAPPPPGVPPVPPPSAPTPSTTSTPTPRIPAPPRPLTPARIERTNPLLDEAFGVAARREPTPRPVVEPRPPAPDRDAFAGVRSRAGTDAPRPGPTGDDARGGAEARLVRALDNLTAALTRPGVNRGAGGRALLVGGGRESDGMPDVRARAEPKPRDARLPDGERREERSPAARGAGGREAGGLGMGLAAGATAAVGIGAALARQEAQPFMSEGDRFWAGARQFQIPGLNVGVSDLRDLQLWLQRKGTGKDRDQENRDVIGIQSTDSMVRRPFEDFKRSYDPRRREVEQRVDDAYGSTADLSQPPPPKPVLRSVRDDYPELYPQGGGLRGVLGREDSEKRKQLEELYRARFEQEMRRYQQEMARRSRAELPNRGQNLPLADLPDQSRSTLGDRHTLERRMGRLPAMDRLQEANRELSAVDAQLAEKKKLAAYHRARIMDLEDEQERQQAILKSPAAATDEFVRKKAAEREADAAKGVKTHQEQRRALDAEIYETEARRAQASGGVREADAGLNRVRLSQMREREHTAAEQARALAYAGPAGRAQAEFAMQLIRESGDMSMLPPEIVGMARPAFGRTIDVMAEQAGQQYVPQFRAQAPDEYRDTLPGVRKQVDQLAAEVRKFEQTNPGEVLRETFEAVKGMYSFWNRLHEELEAFKRQVDAETRARNAGQ